VPAASGRGRIIQVTSSQPGEGKSTVIANLAVALSRSGHRVILIDLDLRRPVQHRMYNTFRSPGYADLFAKRGGPEQLREMLQSVDEFGVELLPAGSKLPDTLAAVMGSDLEQMLSYLSSQYDYVLVDSPPAFVADTSMAARNVDLVLMVARPGVAERNGTRSAVDLLDRVDVAKGLVFNGVAREHTDYAYGNGYYNYGRRYDEGADSTDAAA
jgi:succinoglycan biosynthesis transport protein ExoP